jgi:hypothetical protein
MKRRIVSAVLVVLLAGVSGVCSGCCFFKPSLRKDEASIRQALLEETPLGVDAATVRSRLEQSRRWGDADVSDLRDVGAYRDGPDGRRTLVGASSIQVSLGKYCGEFLFFDTYVTAYYAFDSDGHLEDVWVTKCTDAL